MNLRIFVTILILAITGVWGLFSPSDTIMKLILPIIDLVSILYFITNYTKIDSLFKKPLLIFLIFIIINILGVYFLRGQSFISSIRGIDMLNFLSIYFLFILHWIKLSSIDANKILKFLIWMFIGCYLIQWQLFPRQIFYISGDGAMDSYIDSGNIRFRLQAQGIAFLAFFYSIYKILQEKKWYNYLLLLLSLMIIIMFEFRSQLLILPFVVLLQLLYYRKYRKKKVVSILFIMFLFCVILMQTDFAGNKIQSMQNRSETQNFNNDDYIRYFTFKYYTSTVPQNSYEKIMGTGLEGLDGEYQSYMLKGKMNGYIWADWGIIGLTWVLGIPGVLCLIWYSVKAFKYSRSLPNEYYIGLWFLFLIIVGTFNREFYRFGIFGIQALALYILDEKYKKIK